VGCGQGILARALLPEVSYLGIDLSATLIAHAKQYDKKKNHRYIVGDITKPLSIKETFTHAACVLAMQNIENPAQGCKQVGAHLIRGATFVIVLNHPCFRIPRQSSWGVDMSKKMQYRRIDHYLTPLKIPIAAHPGKKEKSEMTWSFHYPLSAYFHFLSDAGFSVSMVEEWVSPKHSTGKNAKMENRARAEFPLFLAIKAQKL